MRCDGAGEGGGSAVDYCQWETVNVSCAGDDVIILVTSARYGRMRVGRCVPVDYFTGCAVDVLPALERRCSGRHSCSVAVSDRRLFRVQPCRKDLVAYLELAYRCVPGTMGERRPRRGRGLDPSRHRPVLRSIATHLGISFRPKSGGVVANTGKQSQFCASPAIRRLSAD